MENVTPLPPMRENVLLISKKQNKAFLPYTVEELNDILAANPDRYGNLQDVIDDKYVISLKSYKAAFIARFKTAYDFMRKKAQASFLDAFDVALELAFIKYLHPAVIAACKNLDELDIYLDCLNLNELDQFPFFSIEYEP